MKNKLRSFKDYVFQRNPYLRYSSRSLVADVERRNRILRVVMMAIMVMAVGLFLALAASCSRAQSNLYDQSVAEDVESSVTADIEVEARSDLPYVADWSNGMDGWIGPGGWAAVNGMLVSDGEGSGTGVILAPVSPDTPDYYLETELELVRYTGNTTLSAAAGFGVCLRYEDESGVRVGHYASCGLLRMGGPATLEDSASYGLFASNDVGHFGNGIVAEAFFRPHEDVHLLRIEARGNQYTVFLDGALTLDFTDNTALSPGRIGLWVDSAQLNVHSFKIDRL